MSIEDVEKLYNNPLLIAKAFKRVGKIGYKYTLCYEENPSSFVKIIYLFDEKPIKVLNGMRVYRNLDRAILRKYGIRF